MHFGRRHFFSFSLGALAGYLTPRCFPQQGMGGHVAAAQKKPQSSGRPFNAYFTDVAASAGLTKTMVYGGIDHKEYIIEANGCGCAFLDYDNDGWLDIFLLSGTRLEGAPAGASNRLYKNNRDGTFTDVTAQAGLEAAGWANGVCIGDYNNDGYEDIFCTYWGQNRLYRNLGNGTFKDVTKEAGLESPEIRWGAGCTFFDYNRDGHLDLFVSNYLKFDLDHVRGVVETGDLHPGAGGKILAVEFAADGEVGLQGVELRRVDVLLHDMLKRETVMSQGFLKNAEGLADGGWHVTGSDRTRDVERVANPNGLTIADVVLPIAEPEFVGLEGNRGRLGRLGSDEDGCEQQKEDQNAFHGCESDRKTPGRKRLLQVVRSEGGIDSLHSGLRPKPPQRVLSRLREVVSSNAGSLVIGPPSPRLRRAPSFAPPIRLIKSQFPPDGVPSYVLAVAGARSPRANNALLRSALRSFEGRHPSLLPSG